MDKIARLCINSLVTTKVMSWNTDSPAILVDDMVKTFYLTNNNCSSTEIMKLPLRYNVNIYKNGSVLFRPLIVVVDAFIKAVLVFLPDRLIAIP